jgi:beta-RFAP synthase
MIRVQTASRLHFGLFAPNATSGRRFGGLGMMVQAPGIDISLSRAETWSVAGPLAERAWNVLQRLSKHPVFHTCPPLAVAIQQASLEHQGLGTGTQLELALARGLAQFVPQAPRDALALAALVGRGRRSAIGTHGFAQGGFLVDAGKREETSGPAPLLMRLPFPETWRLLLLRPWHMQGPGGALEREKFLALPSSPPGQTDTLCRLALLQILPALLEQDFATFAEALHEFNHKAGEFFKPVQGGIYSHSLTAYLVNMLRNWGITGVGQSSWGPTLFVLTESEGEAEALRERLRPVPELAEYEVLVTAGCNHGAVIAT